jgi:hypothetical protein
MTAMSRPGRTRRRLAGVSGAGPADALALAAALALTAYLVFLVQRQAGGDVAACVAATSMTLPVAFARRAPLPAAATLAAAAAANELFFAHLIRCGAALPAAFYVAYVAGRACAGRPRALTLAGVLSSVVIQCVYDPRLGAAVIPVMVVVSGVFFAGGVLVRHRSALVAQLRRSTEELRGQRERTARLAVAAEQARVTADIRGTLQAGIAEIAGLARAAQASGGDPGASFAAIESAGRSVLESMRFLVGALRDAPTDPEPGLAQLAGLLASATTADARLSVTGAVRPLPASIELAGYRVIEELLTVLRDDPATRLEVAVRFAADCLELRIDGPAAADGELRRVRSVVQARLALYGGTVDIDDAAGRRAARVRLPLVTTHV